MEKAVIINILSDKKVLYAEYKAGMHCVVCDMLQQYFMGVKIVDNGQDIVDEIVSGHYDAMFIDISSPQLKGPKIIKKIRKLNISIPIVIVSTDADRESLWKVVELKITKFLIKPNTKKELLRALEKVAFELASHGRKAVVLGNGRRYSPCKKTIQVNGEENHLSLTESRLLEYFIRHPNCTVSFEDIYDYLWGYEPPSKEALKSLIKDLRKKVGKDIIESIYGIGYFLSLSRQTKGKDN